eukprot:635772-Prymnesium_polylepis.1
MSTWPSHGGTWGSYGGHMGVTWGSHGGHMGVTWARGRTIHVDVVESHATCSGSANGRPSCASDRSEPSTHSAAFASISLNASGRRTGSQSHTAVKSGLTMKPMKPA